MKARQCTLALVVLFVAGCASVEEPTRAVEAIPQAPPPLLPKPIQVAKPAPAPEVAVVAPPRPAELPRPTEVETLVTEFARLRKLAPSELAREQEVARQVFNQLRSDNARVRVAMALAIPGAPASDDGRALEALDPLVKSPGASLHGLAFMLAAYVQEQRRLNLQLAGLQQNVQGLQQNVQGLQQKLDAIKTLERSLSGRAEASPVRRR